MNPEFAMAIPPSFLSFLIFGSLILAAATFAGFRWLRWGRSPGKIAEPHWRGGLAVFGFAASTISLLSAVGLWIHALFTGGFPFYHPILLFAIRVGFWTALMAFVAGIGGKGQLRLPTLTCSVVCLLVWFSEAMAQ